MIEILKNAIEDRRSWYYMRDGEEIGPVQRRELRELLETGEVGADTLVWTPGMDEWQPAAGIDAGEQADARAEVDEPQLSQLPRIEVRRDDDEGGKQTEENQTNYLPPSERPRPVRRLVARSIDWALGLGLFLYGLSLTELRQGSNGALFVFLGMMLAVALYDAAFALLRTRPPGKWLLNIYVRTEQGAGLSATQTFVRAIQVWVMGVAAGIPAYPIAGVPVLPMIAMGIQCYILTKSGRTEYDRMQKVVVSYGQIGPYRALVLFALFLAWLGAILRWLE